MQELSITQQYLICAANEQGKISGFSTEKLVCFVAAALLDMRLDSCISMDGKRIAVTGDLPAGKRHLRPLYEFCNQPKPVKLEKVLEEYLCAVSDKRLNGLMASVGGSLEEMGLAERGRAGILRGRMGYIPTKAALDGVVAKLRRAVFEGGEMTEETAILVTLLEKSKRLNAYFSDHERREIDGNLKQIMTKPAGKLLKTMIDDVDEMTAAMMSALSVLGI